MSDQTTIETSEAAAPGIPQDVEPARTQAARQTPGDVQPKLMRKRKPRPCFEDGSLTRVFKFPSKTYPRSSYYVTSTEIIIRIKKARKKWKLIVPKKRVVSYKTNRWFAKPRWVEIELTVTQATKLGLVEPRPKSSEQQSEAPVEHQVETGASLEHEFSLAETASAAESDDSAECQTVLDLGPENDSEEPTSAVDTADPEPSDPEPLDQDCPIEVPETLLTSEDHDDLDEPHEDAEEMDDTGETDDAEGVDEARETDALEPTVPERDPVPAFVPALPPAVAPRPRHNAVVLTGLLAIGLAGLATVRTIPAVSPEQPMADLHECSGAATDRRCAQDIVTGSIARSSGSPASDSVTLPPSHDDTAVVSDRTEVALLAPSEIAMTPPVGLVEARETEPPTIGDADPKTLKEAAVASAEVPVEPAAPKVVPSSRETEPARGTCGHLGTFAQSIVVRFDYARATVSPATLTSLRAFADQLHACPSAKIRIEGHTDSDGHADRNQVLSLRRAEAVRNLLIEAGALSEQLSSVGYGPSQPAVPNGTAENKRSNRRATLVLEQPS